jgi:dTMP kinase
MPAAHYIGIDSIDGAGKDFQTNWLHQAFYHAGIPCVVVNEPKSTEDGRTLYDMITMGESDRWSPFAEACLWSAARNKANLQYVQPALARGEWVITHRTPLASIAYQGYARGADIELIRAMQHAAVTKWPDYFMMLDITPEQGIQRKTGQKGADGLDRFEKEGIALQEKVRAGFMCEFEKLGGPKIKIDASKSKADVHHALIEAINKQFDLNLKPMVLEP